MANANASRRAEVDRLLAEKDSSSDDDHDDNLGGLARDTYMDKLYAETKSKYQQKPLTTAAKNLGTGAGAADTKKGGKDTTGKLLAGTTAQELIDAVSSDSDDAEMEAMLKSRQ